MTIVKRLRARAQVPCGLVIVDVFLTCFDMFRHVEDLGHFASPCVPESPSSKAWHHRIYDSAVTTARAEPTLQRILIPLFVEASIFRQCLSSDAGTLSKFSHFVYPSALLAYPFPCWMRRCTYVERRGMPSQSPPGEAEEKVVEMALSIVAGTVITLLVLVPA